jgi:hypothetical protein
MRGQMKHKRGDLTAKEIIKIVFAIIGISLLIYLLAGLYGIFERDNEFKQAKSGLAEIKNAIEYVQKEGRETNFILQSKKGWNLIYFETLGKNLCLCFDSNTNPEECINGNSGICEKLEQPFSLQNSKVDSNSNYFELVPPVTEFKLSKKEDKFVLEVFEKSLKEEEETSYVLEFKGEGKFEVLSEEECKSSLEQRKKDLGIPDKLCYWETMTEVYKDKCENLDEAQIKEIFEKKAEYRKLNNPDWPNLNTDGDFCVPVIYDCDAWKTQVNSDRMNLGKNLYGAFIGSKINKIIINPYYSFNKNFVINSLIIHEGLHSIQSYRDKKLYVGEGEKYSSVATEYDPTSTQTQLEILDIHSDINSKIIDLEDIKQIFDLKLDLKKNDEKEFDILDTLISNIGESGSRIIEPSSFNKSIQEVRNFLERHGRYNQDVAIVLQDIYNLNNEAYIKSVEYAVKGYLGEKREVDARLSEIHRWWFDKTAPKCEVIYTKDKAKEVLNRYLSEKNLDEDYALAQKQLKLLIYLYSGTKFEEEVYNDLVNRLPGLAMNEEEGEIIYYG